MAKDYRPRIADKIIERKLKSVGAILIEGPKGCGKTTTGIHMSESVYKMQSPGGVERAEADPTSILKGNVPRLIDEWQLHPPIWNTVRDEVDERGGEPGQFILTGSSVPQEDGKRHSGAWRIARYTMFPMSLFESGDSSGAVSLKSLFDGTTEISGQSAHDLGGILSLIVRGGWPNLIGADRGTVSDAMETYIDTIVEEDMPRVDGMSRDPDAVNAVLRSYARNISSNTTMETIVDDVSGFVGRSSVFTYVNELHRLFVLMDLPAWNPAIRSKATIRSGVKRQFVDPSVAAAVLHIDEDGMLTDFPMVGHLFESLCIRDLRIYAQSLRGRVYYYRDSNNLEMDAVVHLKDGRWGASEIKVGESRVDEAVANLKRFSETVDSERMNPPSFLMVLISHGYAYVKDGVHVVPIDCLRD